MLFLSPAYSWPGWDRYSICLLGIRTARQVARRRGSRARDILVACQVARRMGSRNRVARTRTRTRVARQVARSYD